MIDFLIVSAICFLGLFVGLILSYVAKEEIPSGMKYFDALAKFIISMMIFILFYEWFSVYSVIIVFAFIAFVLISGKNYPGKAVFWIIPVILFGSYFYKQAFLINSALAFFYGFPVASMFFYENRKIKSKKAMFWKLFINYIVYFVFLILTVLAPIV